VLKPNTDSLDPITQRALDELERLTLLGTSEQIQDQLLRVINSSGYIKPLAKVFYKLASQNESDAVKSAQNYFTIIDKWPSSAWAQKALNELTPLILMSEGEVGSAYIQSIWEKQGVLLSEAIDSEDVGENAKTLCTEVFTNMIYLANQQGQHGRLESLSQHPLAQEPAVAEVVALARASASIQSNRPELAQARLQAWLTDWPHSPLRAYAYVLYYEASSAPSEREESIIRVREDYAETLEAKLLERYLSSSGRF
ncbi:hypothetical protein K8I31_20835, partial [bacterium]|nr:hypothetical protein [bacterium]